jgi:hypothetical protein
MNSIQLISYSSYFKEILVNEIKDNDTKPFNIYTPIINKYLIKTMKKKSPLLDIYDNLEFCNYLENKRKKNIKDFDYINDFYFVPKIKINNHCLNYDDPIVENILLKNLSKYQNINAKILIAPKQDKNNCWFNTAFMVFFISDYGKIFSKYFRQFCITGKLDNIKLSDKLIRISLFYLNIYIDSCIQGSNYSMYLNSNFLINRIYKTFPKQFYIKDENQTGCGIYYYHTLISTLNLNNNNNFIPIYKFTIGTNNIHSYTDIIHNSYVFNNYKSKSNYSKSFYNYPELLNTFPDILLIYTNYSPNIKKKMNFKLNNIEYCLDSIVIQYIESNHVCCCITINKEFYLYDGATYSSLIPFKWNTYINSNKEININLKTSKINTIDFSKSNQYLIYYRI